jgi:hypothetical protein
MMFGYTLSNEFLPGEEREPYQSMSTLFDVRIRNGEISYRLYDRLLRNGHSADAPFALESFSDGLEFYQVDQDQSLVPVRGVDFDAVSTFSDRDASRYMNPYLPFGSANVPDEGLGFQLAPPGPDAPEDAKVKVYFTWDR